MRVPAYVSFLVIYCSSLIGKCNAVRINAFTRGYQMPSVIGNSYGIPGVNATYDYLVVGGGTAGLAVAARLAQNYSVAVIEAGGFYQIDNGNGSVIPGLAAAQGLGLEGPMPPLIDWGFKTTPQAGCINRTINYARGKTLGGSSARNLLAYHRPTVGSMQQWADAVDDDSYTWNNTLQYFDRSVNIALPDPAERLYNSSIDFKDVGVLSGAQTGPIEVTWPEYAPPINSWYYQGFQDAGIVANNQAFLAGVVDGIAWTASSMDPSQKQRSTSQTTYMYQAMLETDLKVYPSALAKEITFSENNVATGVRVNTAGQDFHLTADKEVILSAGAFQSPQILMVSGIGPKATLEEHSINVRQDLPGVGQNMWDHVFVSTVYPVNVPTANLLGTDPVYAAQAAQQYLVNQTGILTAPPGMLGWERLTGRNLSGILISQSTVDAMSQFPFDWPEIEYLPADGAAQAPSDGRNYAGIAVALVSPLSRGNITIQSADTSDPPIINPNYLADPADVELLVNGIKRVRQIWSHLTNLTTGAEFLPGPNITTDAQLEQYVRSTLGLVWHPSATCKMGLRNDTMAVVDSTAKVYGTRNLRVVDASAFPFLTPGHPQSVVYMLAEKIADDIVNGR